MKLCIFGNKTSTKALIVEFLKSNITISHLVSLDADNAKNAKISGKDDTLLEFANKQNITVFTPDNYSLKSNNDVEFFKSNHFDLGLSTGWQRIIPRAIVDSFKYGIYGWHGSGFELPNGRGRSPLNWSLRLGLNKIHHNLFKYAYGADDGPIYETEIISIEKEDYIEDLQRKALMHIKKSSLRLINDINSGTLNLLQQPKHPFVMLPKLSEDSGEIFPQSMRCEQSLNIIKSCSRPFPGAFVRKNGKIYRIWKANFENSNNEDQGSVFVLNGKLIIQLRDGCISSDDYDLPIFSI